MPHSQEQNRKRTTQPQYGCILGEIPVPLPSATWHLRCQGGTSLKAIPETRCLSTTTISRSPWVPYVKLSFHIALFLPARLVQRSLLSRMLTAEGLGHISYLVPRKQEAMVQDIVYNPKGKGEWVMKKWICFICHSSALWVLSTHAFPCAEFQTVVAPCAHV